MRVHLLASALLVCAALCNPAQSQDTELEKRMTRLGNNVKKGCDDYSMGRITDEARECVARVSSFVDAIVMFSLPPSQTGICRPKNLNYNDYIRAINSTSFKVPSDLGASGVIWQSLKMAFPCQDIK